MLHPCLLSVTGCSALAAQAGPCGPTCVRLIWSLRSPYSVCKRCRMPGKGKNLHVPNIHPAALGAIGKAAGLEFCPLSVMLDRCRASEQAIGINPGAAFMGARLPPAEFKPLRRGARSNYSSSVLL
ncbi:hypothetical protein HPB50_005675 [Hyalomma asiaticum]|uniref:Uncharacterized protein n=1 Tax=Hyalomma asiaticum TaxID=266040 RepID=A0ACB7S1P1_HYAAI|nr:hypothetical protein HPB50_005675 [Hyalomma asiaticum]